MQENVNNCFPNSCFLLDLSCNVMLKGIKKKNLFGGNNDVTNISKSTVCKKSESRPLSGVWLSVNFFGLNAFFLRDEKFTEMWIQPKFRHFIISTGAIYCITQIWLSWQGVSISFTKQWSPTLSQVHLFLDLLWYPRRSRGRSWGRWERQN